MKIESEGALRKKREKGEMMQSKRAKREEWSEANGETRQRGSSNRKREKHKERGDDDEED